MAGAGGGEHGGRAWCALLAQVGLKQCGLALCGLDDGSGALHGGSDDDGCGGGDAQKYGRRMPVGVHSGGDQGPGCRYES